MPRLKKPNRDRALDARREMYRKLVTEAAEAVFAEKGFTRTTMGDIALEAGISRKTLYRTFSNKEEVFEALQAQRYGQIRESTVLAAEGAANPLEAILQGMKGSTEFLIHHPNFLRMQLRDGSTWAVRPRKGSGSGEDRWQDGLQMTHRALRKGMEEGVILQEDPDLLSKITTAIHQVELANWLEQEDRDDPQELVARVQRRIRRLLEPVA